jgi:tripartite-type tricarboxylate transporter receptor subunit TctC
MRRLFRSAALLAASALFSVVGALSQGSAEDLSSRPIRIVSPFAAASVSDISLRILGERLGARLGTQIIFENQPTGGGVVAAKAVITSPPDGHTLALLSNATAVSAALFKNLPYVPIADFTPIGSVSDFSYIFLTNAKSNLRSVQDLIAAARAKPGAMNFGTAAAGTSPNLTAVLFRKVSGIDFTVVPFRGATDLTVALLRNDVDVVINAYGAVKANLNDGSLRAIATTAATRTSVLPDVPTVGEAGIANFEVSSWNGLLAPRNTPPDVIERLNRELRLTLAEPEIVRRFKELGLEVRPSSPAELEERLRSEIARWSRVIDEAGIERQ